METPISTGNRVKATKLEKLVFLNKCFKQKIFRNLRANSIGFAVNDYEILPYRETVYIIIAISAVSYGWDVLNFSSRLKNIIFTLIHAIEKKRTKNREQNLKNCTRNILEKNRFTK